MVRKSSITSMFAGSPVRPLQQHMEKVHECVAELVPFFEAVIRKDFDEAAKVQQRIHKLEVAADDLKHELRIHLPNSLFMPMPRERILDIVTIQDQVANKAKDIAGVMTGRQTEIPDQISGLFLGFVKSSVDASAQALNVVNELDELVEVGFRGLEVTAVETMIDDLDKLEYEADKFEKQVRAAFFTFEKDIHPVDAVFLYKIIDWVGNIADISQRVGARLELLLAR